MGASREFREPPAVRAEALCISRGGRLLVEGLSFTADAGDFVEVRGPNGSGKTSLIRVIAGFMRPRAGRVWFDQVEDAALALHFLGHLNGLKPAASVVAHARYWAGLLGGGGVDEALARVGLAHAVDLPARVLSQGQQRRLALSRLLIAPRPIWLLDEPAAALDDQGRALVAELVAAHCAAGGVALAAVHEPLGPAPNQTIRMGRST
jgi:heme exporter protein A